VTEVLYVTFGDYCRIAAEVLGTTPEQIAWLPGGRQEQGILTEEVFAAQKAKILAV
jgi:hypothetical protein